MLFNSFGFLLVFLPAVLVISLRVKGQSLLRWLALTSFFFYSFAGHAWFLIPMLVTTCLDFFMAPLIASAHNQKRRKLYLMVSLVGNLGLLFYFKYSGLLVRTAEAVALQMAEIFGFKDPGWSLAGYEVILPAGISFYTFQTLSYIIDVYRGQAEPEHNFWRFAGFVSFFPHLVAGPLTRHNQLIPQLTGVAQSGIRPRWEDGIYLFAIGLCKKVLIADRIANLTHPYLGGTGNMTIVTAWLALFGFTMQIYFDFSGYTDMAIGLGRLFGIELPQNFNSPYQALNPSDFWRRWHITLSRWLRDYLYISLGGNRCSHFRRNLNLMLTMILGGLWHGASWTFAIWGFYHGLLLVVFHQLEGPWSKLPAAVQRTVTFFLVMIGWLFFRAETFSGAMHWLKNLFIFGGSVGVLSEGELKLVGFILSGLLVTQLFPNASSAPSLPALRPFYKFSLGVLTFFAILMLGYSSRFLYFQF
jgi:alginate O-acetyltransferase complex protein AlgI